ncbi:LOW QUALITY PROTEIN: hypothetical protein Cgig2_030527 [Carnegiea gigantea]|uniref:Reverse transcriptase domain-containing protein n=1 Tax=Carnegiea gigantea TaxID=171969 RepID=A0A9Q1GJK1_9CARY|nr:LOW QUALITY PROTEIN: hypothetical protein Cgig2_030527 [Carnegiea gigantea]
MVDALKNFMSTMTNTIIEHVTKQVNKAMEVASSVRPLPHFDYMPATGCKPSHRAAPVASHRHSDGVREAYPDKNNGSRGENCDQSIGADEHPMLKRPPSMTSAPKPHNVWKYCEFHEKNVHTTTKCQELRKALHELAYKGQIDHFLKRGSTSFERNASPYNPNSRRRVLHLNSGHHYRWICRGYHSVRLESSTSRSQAGSHGQVGEPSYDTHDGVRGGSPHFASSHNELLVVKMEVASAIRILINTWSSVDIITWDCLKKLKYLGRKIVPLVHPILGFGGQEVNPTGMIRLSLHFGKKTKVRNLKVDFLVVDVPMAYNVILGRPTLHKVKAIITSCLLQFRLTMGALASCKGTSERPENANLLVSDHWPKTRKDKKQARTLYIKCPDPQHYCCLHAPRHHGLHHQKSLPPRPEAWSPHHLDEIHQLKISTINLGLTTIVYVLDVRLKISLLAEGSHQAFPKELRMVLMAPPVALMLGLGRFLSPCHGLSLYLRMGLFELALQVSFFSLQHLFLFLDFLPMNLPTVGALPGNRGFTSLGLKRDMSILRPLVPKQMRGEPLCRRKAPPHLSNGHLLLGDLERLRRARRARAQDLIRLSTKAYLTGRSAAKKSIPGAWGFNEGSPVARGVTC